MERFITLILKGELLIWAGPLDTHDLLDLLAIISSNTS